MTSESRNFIRSTACLLDHLLDTLTHEEQHDLLDTLAAVVEEHLDALMEVAGA